MILISPSIALLLDFEFNHSRKCLEVPIHKKLTRKIYGVYSTCNINQTKANNQTNKQTYVYDLSLWGLDGQDAVVILLVEPDGLGVVKDAEEMSLDGVGVRRLTQDLQKGGVWHEEEAREQQTLLLKVPVNQKYDLVLFRIVNEKVGTCETKFITLDWYTSLSISSDICMNMLLKSKGHSLRCHGLVVHTLLLRMNNNVVDFRVMRKLCHRLWNWQSVNHIPGIHDNGPCDQGLWRLTLTAYWLSRFFVIIKTLTFTGLDIVLKTSRALQLYMYGRITRQIIKIQMMLVVWYLLSKWT